MYSLMKCIKCDWNIYKCKFCNIKLKNDNELSNHICQNILKDNIYKFDLDTFGKKMYSNFLGGDIYIIQTDNIYSNYYKVGITTNLINRLSVYRCGCVIEPILHCYFPIKNIKEADKVLKKELQKYVIKREIYKINNIDDVKNIICNIQNTFASDKLIFYPIIKTN
jgi:hypothetical protein